MNWYELIKKAQSLGLSKQDVMEFIKNNTRKGLQPNTSNEMSSMYLL